MQTVKTCSAGKTAEEVVQYVNLRQQKACCFAANEDNRRSGAFFLNGKSKKLGPLLIAVNGDSKNAVRFLKYRQQKSSCAL
jgi:hypothetical protein